MTNTTKPFTLIAGVGEGLSTSLARLLYREGHRFVFALSNTTKLGRLAGDTHASLRA